jgi:hypothetical protein
MSKRPTIRWKGDLAQPVRWKGPPTKRITPSIAIPEPSAEAHAENARRFEKALLDVFAESNRKLERLKEYFAIPPGPMSDRLLALRLAMLFVPGFKLILKGEGRGRKRKTWTDFKCIALICDVEAMKEALGTESDVEALRKIVSRKNRYIGGLLPRTISGTNKKAASLNARFVEAQRRASDDRFQPFLTPEARSFFQRLLNQLPKLLESNFD